MAKSYEQSTKSLLERAKENVKTTVKPQMQAEQEALLAGKSEGDKADAINTATQHLTATKEAIANTPEQDRATLLEQQKTQLAERAALEGREMSTGERLAMVFLGAAPAVAAAATGRSNVAQAVQAGNQSVQNIYGIHADETKRLVDQKDTELGVTKENMNNAEDLIKQSNSFEQQDKLAARSDARADKRVVSAEKRAAAAAEAASNKVKQSRIDNMQKMQGTGARTRTAKLKEWVDNADRPLVLINQISKDATGKNFTDLSPEEIEQVLNHANESQRSEVTSSLDRLVSGGSPTISGRDHLQVKTLGTDAQKWQQFVTGKTPLAHGAGHQIKKQLDTILRERALGASKYDEEIQKIIVGNEDLYNDPDPAWRNKARGVLGAPKTLDEVLNESNADRKMPPKETLPPSRSYTDLKDHELEAELKRRGL